MSMSSAPTIRRISARSSLGRKSAGRRIVTAGLHPGDRIIVDGLQRVQPGAVVDVHQQVAAR